MVELGGRVGVELDEYFFSTIFGGAEIDLRIDACRCAIAFGNPSSEVVGLRFMHEVDGATAEAAAGHSATNEAGQAFG